MAQRALILVDLQNDFCAGGSLEVPRGDEVIEVANILAPRFGVVIATQDWHPPGHKSFASSHPGHAVGEVIDLEGLPQVLWPDHCVQGTAGAELVAGLHRTPITEVVQKGTDARIDSYSGFFDNGHRKATELSPLLRSLGVTALAVMGLATDYCVKFTVLDGLSEGFSVRLIDDGCRGVDLSPGDSARAIDEMRAAGAEVVSASAAL
ncbi:MAG TPA: bifunctional nicotinamidase/pyrazinamidase [Kofleriaceae bacterium]|nr:bifunctional nicotinamidase/pyrazinamidase [Kofleriaceae bacterium]